MLDKNRVTKQLEQMVPEFFVSVSKQLEIAGACWNWIVNPQELLQFIGDKDISFSGCIDESVKIQDVIFPYDVISSDGSQIYPDRHQSIACFLVNIGIIHLSYGQHKSSVRIDSTPQVYSYNQSDIEEQYFDVPFVNAKRDEAELSSGLEKCKSIEGKPIFISDGSYVLSHLDPYKNDADRATFMNMLKLYDDFYKSKILHCSYISFCKNKDLVGIIKKVLNSGVIKGIDTDKLDQITDSEICSFFLQPYNRSTIFKVNMALSNFYTPNLKPYFIYINTGNEIARIEFPQWIAIDSNLLDLLCSIVIDQCKKGHGYPVALSEAHEAAVVKSTDREFFYSLLHKITDKQNRPRSISQKSQKKRLVAV